LIAQIGQPNTRTFSNKRFGDGSANAAGRSGYQCNLAAQSQVMALRFSFERKSIYRIEATQKK
jgi:hypothetical protein